MDKERFDKELEIKQQETENTIMIRKEELLLKKYETEANIELRERELELQENLKKEELKKEKLQFMKEMLNRYTT